MRPIPFLLALGTCLVSGPLGALEQRGSPVLDELVKLTASDGFEFEVFGEDVALSGDLLIVSSRLDNDGGADAGSAYIFERTGSPASWTEVTELHAPTPAAGQWFGSGVALDGDRAVVGSEPFGGGPGEVYVFERDAGGPDNWGWVATLTAGESIGQAVAIDGDRIVASRSGADAAYVFERDEGGPGNWGLVATLTPAMKGPAELFGVKVAIEADTIVVGSSGFVVVPDPGAAYIFERDRQTGLWTETARLAPSGPSGLQQFGLSVAIDGDTVAVGSALEADAGSGTSPGAAYLFGRDHGGAGAWGQLARLVPSDPESGQTFGASVSVDGDSLLVGAFRDDNRAGSAYWLSGESGNWVEVAKLVASDRASLDEFGRGVWLEGDTAAAGAPFDDDLGTNSGSAYVFDLTALVFSDGFESGDTSAWSEVVP